MGEEMALQDNEEDGAFIPVLPRITKSYPITETELDMLRWLPFWARWRMIKRIKDETVHYAEIIE